MNNDITLPKELFKNSNLLFAEKQKKMWLTFVRQILEYDSMVLDGYLTSDTHI